MSDVATTPRGAMSQMRRLQIFERHRGVCVLCEQRIRAGDTWIVEHLRALGLGGSDDEGNLAPAHEQCRRMKDKTDVAAIAKAKRMKAKHFGIKKPQSFRRPLGSRFDWKRNRYVREIA